MIETILLCISVLLMGLYIGCYTISRGLPASLSETYYHTESKWLFSCTISIAAICAWLPLIKVTPDSYLFLAFFIIASIIFVAASPTFKDEFVGKVHKGAAIVLGATALTWIIAAQRFPFLTFLLFIVGVVDRKRFVFWLEIGILADLYWYLFVLLHICIKSSQGV